MSPQTLTHALFYLAAHPEYIASLREEARVVSEEGWTKAEAALGKMHKIDSFLRESLRMNGIGIHKYIPPILPGCKILMRTATTP
jgi:cytochrome P450